MQREKGAISDNQGVDQRMRRKGGWMKRREQEEGAREGCNEGGREGQARYYRGMGDLQKAKK